jgi:hypothetical protein
MGFEDVNRIEVAYDHVLWISHFIVIGSSGSVTSLVIISLSNGNPCGFETEHLNVPNLNNIIILILYAVLITPS